MEDYKESIRIYNKCNIENENTAKAYNYLGMVTEEKEERVQYFKKAISIFKNCNIENQDVALANYHLAKICDNEDEQFQYLWTAKTIYSMCGIDDQYITAKIFYFLGTTRKIEEKESDYFAKSIKICNNIKKRNIKDAINCFKNIMRRFSDKRGRIEYIISKN